MTEEKIKVTGLINLVKQGMRVNKRTVTIPKSNWELIQEIISRVKLEIPMTETPI